MSNKATSIEVLFDKMQDYAKTTIELTKLNAIAKSADVISSFITRIVISIAVAMFILLLSLGLCFMIGEMMGNIYWGFFIVSSFYLLLSILLYLFKNQWVKLPLSNSIIAKLLKNID